MVVKVAESNLPELLSWLQQYLPETFQLYEELKNHLRGKFPDCDFYVDRWPNPQAVAAVVDPLGKELGCKDAMVNDVQGLFGLTDAAVAKLLKDSRIVDWSKAFLLCALAERLWPVAVQVAEEMQVLAVMEKCYLLKGTSQDVQKLPVPEGMKMMALSVDHSSVIDSVWKFSGEGSEAFIKEQIYQFPSVLLTTDDGQHIGHMVGHFYGVIGMLHVFPRFRGNGFAKVIISQLSQKYFDNGEDVYVFVEEDNQQSKKLHESLGFKTLQNFQFAWIRAVPKDFERVIE